MATLGSISNVFKYYTPNELRPVWEDSRAWTKAGPRTAGSALPDRTPSPAHTPLALSGSLNRPTTREERSFTFYQPPSPVEEQALPSPQASSADSALLPRLEEDQIHESDDENMLSPDSSHILESDGDCGHYAKKRRRSLHSRDEELFSDPDHIEETTEDGHTPRSTRSRQRSQYLDPLDIAEGRGQRYRNLSEGPSLDPAVYAAVRKVVGEIKLESSKSPILDALVYCALKGWGMRLTKNEGDDIRITVDDFQEYYRCSAVICSKEHPTEDQSARIKALRRWFPDFPAKQDEAIMLNQPFEVQVMRTASKDNKPRKLREIISRMTAVVAAEKRNNKRPREE